MKNYNIRILYPSGREGVLRGCDEQAQKICADAESGKGEIMKNNVFIFDHETETESGFYSEKTFAKIADALVAAREWYAQGGRKVSISKGNAKTGDVASVSLLPYYTCPAVCGKTCATKCYAAKLAMLRPSVLTAWARNTVIMETNIYYFFDEIASYIRTNKPDFFRFHVGGDIPNKNYLEKMVQLAQDFPEVEFMAFTKRYEWIEDYGYIFPTNLQLVVSGWTDFRPENPLHLTETTVIPKGGEKPEGFRICSGHCATCASAGVNCWDKKGGQKIAFHVH